MRFTKMHGIGNDYVYINTFEEVVDDPSSLAVTMARQHFGVGADGLVLIGPSDTADFSMRMFNKDGSEGEMCGNASRCVGKYVYERGLTTKTHITLSTLAGIKQLWLTVDNGVVTMVRVNMGTPELTPRNIPVALAGEVILRHRLQVLGQTWFITAVNMGNPHCVVFVRDPEVIDLPTIGPMLETHPIFPNHANVEFVRVVSREELRMRVWERGSGETLACGTGACAALVAGVLCGLTDRTAKVRLPGGTLEVTWQASDNHVYQAGPAAFVFDALWLGGQ